MLGMLLVGAAVASGALGAKKGYDATNDFSDAQDINREAQEVLDKAEKNLEQEREATQLELEALGQLKVDIYQGTLTRFVEAFSKIKNVEFDDANLFGDQNLPPVTENELKLVEKSTVEVADVLKGGASSLGSGALAGMAAFGGVGALGTASTGTSIAALSGVAAQNATLAWLGGGSLAVGGYGVAGGTAVLGGVVAGPVLAVGGMMMASKAEEAKENARESLSKAKLNAEEMENAQLASEEIRRRAEEMRSVLRKLDELAGHTFIPSLEKLVEGETDFAKYSDEDQDGLFMTATLVTTLKNVMETTLIGEEGLITKGSRESVKIGKEAAKEAEEEFEEGWNVA